MRKTCLFAIAALLLIISYTQFSCSKSSSGATPNSGGSSTSTVIINMSNMTFSPAMVTVAKGTIIQWQNNDPYAHHVKSNDGDSTSFESADIPGTSTTTSGGGYYGGTTTTTVPGGTFLYTTNAVGTFPYHCTIHGLMMSGTLVVNP
jgi:plastocyanin